MDSPIRPSFAKLANSDVIMQRLKGNHIHLRKLRIDDALAIYSAIDESRKELDSFFSWSPLVREVRDTEDFIKSRRKVSRSNFELVLGVFANDDKSYLGNVGLHPVAGSPHSCEVGYWIRTSQTGKGIASAAAALATIAAFEEFEFHRLVLRASVDNAGSNRVAEKLGMKHGGIQRHELQVLRGYLDLNYYTLLEDEYRVKRGEIRSLAL